MSKQLYIGIGLQDGFLTDTLRRMDYVARVESFLTTQDKSSVVLTRFVNRAGSSFETLLDWPDMQAGDATTQLFGNLESAGYDVIEKTSYTAWLPYVQEKVAGLGATELVLFGLDSDACVLKTALDVFEAGYRPIVLTDLCNSSGGDHRHNMGLELLKTLIGERQIMTSDMMMPVRA